MQDYVRDKINELIDARKDDYTAEDLLRCFAQEATLMYKSDEVIRTLGSDPYEHLGGIKNSVERLCRLLRVTDFEKVLTKTGYCRIVATVQLQADGKMDKVGVFKYVELFFEYERDGTQSPGEQTSVWYSIDVARDDGPREKVLWVKVFAAGAVPSALPAKNLDEEEDGWEDIDDEVDDESTGQAESKMKKARVDEVQSEDEKMEDVNGEIKGEEGEGEEEAPLEEDRFTAGMDPDALEQFLHWTQLEKMEDATVFFLLMSFPFYEMEFDLTGFVLDAVFGPEDDDDEEEASDMEN